MKSIYLFNIAGYISARMNNYLKLHCPCTSHSQSRFKQQSRLEPFHNYMYLFCS